MALPADTTRQSRSRSPQHDPVFIWPTPNQQDLLFWVEKNGDLPKNQQFSYGDPFPDAVKYPNHKLVYVAPQAEDKWSRWYYASSRISEDEYNWEMEDAGLTGAKFLQVTRTYLTLRASFDAAAPAMGAAMPNVPAGKFTGAFVLADRKQIRASEQEFDALFVAEQRVYIQKEILIDIAPDPGSGIGYRKTTTLHYRGENITFGGDTKTIEQWVADPVHVFWSTDSSGFARAVNQLTDNWYAITHAKVVDLNAVYEKESNRLRPEKFYCPKDTVKTTTTSANNTPGPPSTPSTSLGSSVSVIKIGRIEKVTTTTQSGQAQTLKSLELLSEDGYIYPATEELVSSADVPTIRSYINSSGQAITFNNVDACNAVKATRQAISLENELVKTASQLIPTEFLDSEITETLVETTLGSVGAPLQPIASDKQLVKVRKKGVVEVKETMTQVGATKVIKGTAYMSEDGNTYATEREILLASQAPSVPEVIRNDGTVETYEPSGANHVIKTKRVVESTEPRQTKKVSKLAPEKFFREQKTLQVDTTSLGVSEDPPDPSAADRTSTEVEQRGRIRRQRTVSQLGNLAPIKSTSFDERTGESFPDTEELVAAAQVAPTGISDSGDLVSYQGVDAQWSTKRTRKLVSSLEKSWTEVINYEWPPVLVSLDFAIWERKAGGEVVYPIPRYKQGFTGPQAVQVRQWWQKAQPVPIIPVSMVAEGIQFWSPLYSITIPPCLHTSIQLQCNIGSSDPEWVSQNFSQVFQATNVTDWPDQIVWTESKPYLGGFLMHQYTLNKPS